MDLISLLVILIIFGVIMWLVETTIPMPAYIRTVIRVVIVLILVIWLLKALLGLPSITIR